MFRVVHLEVDFCADAVPTELPLLAGGPSLPLTRSPLLPVQQNKRSKEEERFYG